MPAFYLQLANTPRGKTASLLLIKQLLIPNPEAYLEDFTHSLLHPLKLCSQFKQPVYKTVSANLEAVCKMMANAGRMTVTTDNIRNGLNKTGLC